MAKKRTKTSQLAETLALHLKWKNGDKDGVRANLRNADLRNADLRNADLRNADLYSADLRRADLSRANLYSADLRRADLSSANLYSADLRSADLRSADLSSADLRSADLKDARLPAYALVPEKGAFIAYKRVRSATLELEIPADAQRASSLVGRKCRASKAKVIGVVSGDDSDLSSLHNSAFRYVIGETAIPDAFDDDPRIACAPGIHFFISKTEADDYAN